MSYSTPLWTSNNSAPGCIVPRNDFDCLESCLDSGSAIPLLWSTCFSGRDLNIEIAPEEDWSSEDEPHHLASCDTQLQNALSRIEHRLPSLLKIVPSHAHDICRLFQARLAQSQATHLHVDISWLIADEANPADDSWRKNFAKMLDGLDEPVTKIRDGFLCKVLGLGIPSGWNDACFWAMSARSAKLIRAYDVDFYSIVGCGGIEELRSWKA